MEVPWLWVKDAESLQSDWALRFSLLFFLYLPEIFLIRHIHVSVSQSSSVNRKAYSFEHGL